MLACPYQVLQQPVQHSQNVEQGNVYLEKIQRNPRYLCACATLGQKLGTVAGLRRHCDILGRMVRESDTLLLLLGSNNYPPQVAEKFCNIYLLHVAEKLECSECIADTCYLPGRL